jgi:hypothetical protein
MSLIPLFMFAKQALKQLLEENQIDPEYFDLESFCQDQHAFQAALEKTRARHPDLASEPVWSLHQVLKEVEQ